MSINLYKPCAVCGGALVSARDPAYGPVFTPIHMCSMCGKQYRNAGQSPGFTTEGQKKFDRLVGNPSEQFDAVVAKYFENLDPKMK